MAEEKLILDWTIEKPSIITPSEIASASLPFDFRPSETQTLAKFVLNHTLPAINSRGRAVTYPTQKRSIASIQFNPVNLNHIMRSNPVAADQDLILGVMLAASIEDIPGDPVIPAQPIPTNVYAVLWNRIDEVQRIINDIENGFRSWRISMEATRERTSDEIMVGNDFIPFTQAPDDLLNTIGADSIGTYNGQKVALVIGGRNGIINYWGAAFTLTPADRLNPEVELETASKEITSPKKFIISMPTLIENAAATRGTAEQNNLPDEAFAIILPGGKKDTEGKTMPRSLRKLPHHTSEVKDPDNNTTIDKPLLQNALARVNQIKPPIYRTKAKNHLISHAKKIFPDQEYASILEEIQRSEQMDKEELKKVTASISPELQTVIEVAGIEAPEAKKIIEAFNAHLTDELTKKESEIKKEFADYISKADYEKLVAEAVSKKLAEELPKAKEAWQKEIDAYAKREKDLADAGIEVTDQRKERIRSFEVSEDGDKVFAGYLADLKNVKETTEKSVANTDKKTDKSKDTASDTTGSYGNLLNNTDGSGKPNSLAGAFA